MVLYFKQKKISLLNFHYNIFTTTSQSSFHKVINANQVSVRVEHTVFLTE